MPRASPTCLLPPASSLSSAALHFAALTSPVTPSVAQTALTALPSHPQIRSVIRRSRETGHVHPMSREPSPRRRLDPATLSRTPSQEQLIAELQGRLGIQLEAEEVAGASAQDWLTEGVVITVQPRGRRAGGQLVEKVASKCQSQGLGSGVWRFPQLQCWLKKILGWWVGFCVSWPYDKAGHTTLPTAVWC